MAAKQTNPASSRRRTVFRYDVRAGAVAISEAPGDLAIVQAFVNTVDLEEHTDELASPDALADWLLAAGLLKPGRAAAANAAALRQALRLREALRGVLRSHTPPHLQPHAAVATLRETAGDLNIRLEVSTDGEVRPMAVGEGIDEGLGRLLLIAAEAATEGTWTRLKACSADGCQWAFYDYSPTKNACWCTMQICGSRSKSRAYRRREATSRDHVLVRAPGRHRP